MNSAQYSFVEQFALVFIVNFLDKTKVTGKRKAEEEATHSFAPGDTIEVAEGELIHLQGKILTIDGNTITIMPKHEDLKVRKFFFVILLFL